MTQVHRYNDWEMKDMLRYLQHQFRGAHPDEEKTNHHELRMEYPVLGLIPVHQRLTVILDPPIHSRFRDKPDRTKFHLPLSGTDFTLRLPIKRQTFASVSALNLPPVFEALMSISNWPGRSTLSMATYHCPERGDLYCFRLVTVDRGSDLGMQVENELNSFQWKGAQGLCHDQIFLPLIRNLIYRESDRAYFHVDDRLRTYQEYNERQTEEEWGVEPACDAKGLLSHNLVQGAGSRSDGSDGFLFLRQCGHRQTLSVEHLTSMSATDAIVFTCRHCRRRGLQDEDRKRLRLWRDREKRAAVCEEEELWQRLEEEYCLGPQRINVTTRILERAVHHARVSIWAPNSASPLTVQIPDYFYFREVFDNFCRDLLTHDFTEIQTAAELFDALKALLNTLETESMDHNLPDRTIDSLPSGWLPLTNLLLKRAAELASVPGYNGKGIRSVFEDEVAEDEEVVAARHAAEQFEEMILSVPG